MATINTASIRKQLEEGLNAVFGDTYRQYSPQWKEIFAEEKSDKWKEEEVALSGLGLASVMSEGEGINYDEMGERWSAIYVHEQIKHGFKITKQAIEDNLYESYAKRGARALARSFAQTKEVKGARILNDGFSAYLTGDAVALFATTHPVTGGTASNKAATASGFNETSLEEALIAIQGFTDDRGLKIMVTGKKLIIPRQLQFVAARVLKSAGRSGTADNDINAVRDAMPFHVNQFLTSTTAWYILTDVPDSFKHFVRVPLSTAMEGEFDTDTMKYKGRTRYSFGVSDWRGGWANAGV